MTLSGVIWTFISLLSYYNGLQEETHNFNDFYKLGIIERLEVGKVEEKLWLHITLDYQLSVM